MFTSARVRVRVIHAALSAATLALAASSAWAQAAAPGPAPAPASGTAVAASSAQPAAPAAPFTAGWQDGFSLQSSNGDYKLGVGVLTQIDGRFDVDKTKPITNTFLLRKARPTFSGRIAKYFDFRFMPDLGNGATAVLDAYLDIRFSSKFRIRTGKDKTPVGYELLISDAGLFFPERALTSSLVPNRDIGVQAQGDLADGKLFYAGGVFNGIPDGTSTTTELDTNNGKDLAGRVVIQPFRTTKTPAGVLNGFGFQLGGSTGKQTGALPSFKTSVGQTFFSYTGANANGKRDRFTPAAFYYYKSLGVFGEYVSSTQAVTKGATTSDITNTSWDVSAEINLTGEAASTLVPKPKRPFDPPTSKWGAIQLVLRYSELKIDGAAFDADFATAGSSRKAQQITIGANWVPVYYVKYYLNYERTVFDGAPHGARLAENVILFRTQLAF